MADHVIADFNSSSLFCRHCGDGQPMGVNVPLQVFLSKMEGFGKAHAACPKPAVLETQPPPDRPEGGKEANDPAR